MFFNNRTKLIKLELQKYKYALNKKNHTMEKNIQSGKITIKFSKTCISFEISLLNDLDETLFDSILDELIISIPKIDKRLIVAALGFDFIIIEFPTKKIDLTAEEINIMANKISNKIFETINNIEK